MIEYSWLFDAFKIFISKRINEIYERLIDTFKYFKINKLFKFNFTEIKKVKKLLRDSKK